MLTSFKLLADRPRHSFYFTRTALLVSFFLVCFTRADAQWMKGISGSGSQLGKGIAVDAAGNVFTTGIFAGTTDFDPGAGTFLLSSSCPCDVSNPPKADIYLAKYDRNGGFLWALRIGGSDADVAGGVSVDASGNVLVTGTFWGSSDFDPGPSAAILTSAGSSDIFLAKYDGNGALLWAKDFGGILNDTGDDIAVDALGNCVVTGSFLGTADLDPGPGTTTFNGGNTTDAFFAKFNSSGDLLWARDIQGTGEENGHSIALSPNGDVYITGTFFGTTDLDAGAGAASVTGAGSKDTYLAKYDGSGQFLWGKSFGAAGDEQAVDIAADAAGNLYAVGYFVGTVDFNPDAGTTILTSASGLFNGFLMKLASDGTFGWAFSIGAGADDAALSVSIGISGESVVTGYFQSTVDFDPGPGTSFLTATGNEMFLASYSSAGSFLWAQREGAGGDEAAYGTAVDANGFIYATGYFTGTTSFETGLNTVVLSSAGGNDAFLLKFAAPSSAVLPVKFISFSGSRNENDVLLKWSTAEDPDNSGFFIERSTAENSTWQQLGFIPPAGTRTATYEFKDLNAPASNLLYRLRQIDLNGHSTYSSLISIRNHSENTTLLSQNIPNPVSGSTRIEYNLSHPSTLKLLIFTSTGQKVFETTSTKQIAGPHNLNIDCSGWKSGVYYYQLITDEASVVKTMIVQKRE